MNTIRRRGRPKPKPMPSSAGGQELPPDDCPPIHWAPPFKIAWYGLLAVRLVTSTVLPIGDCDEIFNNWEPTHYLMYGTGFQTWEYSPQFALRPYLFPAIHATIGSAAQYLGAVDKISVFFFIKYFIAVLSATCEARFYDSIRSRFGETISLLTLMMLMFTPGMALASNSFLPSTFAMCMLMLSWGALFRGEDFFAVLWGLIGTIISGWPFCAVAAVPMAITVLFRSGFVKAMLYGIFGLVVTVVPQVMVDWYFFGKPLCTVCNLVWYNVRGYITMADSDDVAAQGPKLYGEEPWYFYFLNLSLNFGPLLPIAMPAVLSLIGLIGIVNTTEWVAWWPNAKKEKEEKTDIDIDDYDKRLQNEKGRWTKKLLLDIAYISPLFLWLAFMIPQAHKEERFIFVVYPILCLTAATVLGRMIEFFELPSSSPKVSGSGKSKKDRQNFKRSLVTAFKVTLLIVMLLFTTYRLAVLSTAAGASAESYTWLARHELKLRERENGNVNICVGREWHRFPSSFFLTKPNFNLKFVKSAFDGQLPQPFLNDTSVIQPGFNDKNTEEMNRYIDVKKCDYLVDMELVEQKEPRYHQMSDEWRVVFRRKFLDYTASKPIWRSFCLPWGDMFGADKCVYGDWFVLRRV